MATVVVGMAAAGMVDTVVEMAAVVKLVGMGQIEPGEF